MSLVSLGDLAQSFLLRRQNFTLKADLERLSTELTTGRVFDVAARVSGDLVPLAGINTSLSRLDGYASVTAETGVFAGVLQTALQTIDELSSDLASTLITAASTAQSAQIDGAAADAFQKFQSAISVLNTRFGDRTIFAGVGTTGPAVAGGTGILAAIEGGLAGLTSAAAVEAAVSAWFDLPAGYSDTAYLGGTVQSAVAIAPGETTSIDVTANDPALRSTLKGLAMAALLDRGVLAGNPEARRDLARRAGLNLLESQSGRVQLSARLGRAEAQIEAASARNSAESTALQIARAGLLAADPYETATKLQETQTQLEMIYSITARMTRLSLVDYLK